MMARNLPSPDAGDLLNSWKEIAAYLNRGVRTVQRWESDLGLPVRRPRAKDRSAVIALRSEIDAWTRTCMLGKPGKNGHMDMDMDMDIHMVVDATSPMLLRLQEQRTNTRKLRADVHRTRQEVKMSLDLLLSTLNKVISQMPATMPAVIEIPAVACTDIAEA